MKSPKLFGQPGATMAKGKAKARALQGTGAPFLTARGPGYTARMKNGFLKVEVDEAEQAQEQPIFWMLSNASPEKAQTATARRKVKTLAPTTDAVVRINSRAALNVGANRMAYVAENRSPLELGDIGRLTWPVLGSVRAAGNFDAYPQAREIIRALFATGWDATRNTWRWGYSTKAMGVYDVWTGEASTSEPAFECPLRVLVSGLDLSSVVENTPPNEGNRVYYGGLLFVTGPGKLAGIMTVGDYMAPGDTLPTTRRVTPYLLSSSDHGETWAQTSMSFVEPFIKTASFGRWSASALRLMGSFSFFAYMGEGKSIFVLRYLDTGSSGLLLAKAYLFEAGGFTALAWAYDASPYVPTARTNAVSFSVSGPFFQPDDGVFVDPDTTCFGPGCLALQIAHTTDPFASWGLRITRDFGTTWSELLFTAFLGAAILEARMVVAQPYLSEEAPGLIYLVAASGAGMAVFKTDGRFLTATLLGTVPGANWTGATLINKGASPYPQLPDEFGPPT